MKIVTSIFNSSNAINTMLKILLHSAAKNEPKCDLIVYHTDLSSEVMGEINRKVPNVTFKFVAHVFDNGKEMASQKMALWKHAIDDLEDGDEVALMDCDMLIVKPIDNVLDEFDCDFAYTAKDDIKSRCPLNTGIVFFRKTPLITPFLHKWCKDTNTKVKNGMSVKEINYYGAADQMVLCSLIGSFPYHGVRVENGLRLFGLFASEYNSHRHWDNIENAKIIHFKTGWKNVLNSDIQIYTEALKLERWHESTSFDAKTWQPSYDIWKQYEKEYEEL